MFGASSAFIGSQAMYISGGSNVSKTFLIDFTQDWHISVPVCRQLSNGPSGDLWVLSALFDDRSLWLVLFASKVYEYDIQLDLWSLISTLYDSASALLTSGAVDPSTGLLYIPNGVLVAVITPIVYTLMQYDIVQNKSTDITALGAPSNRLFFF
jgi:hypothetical protein